MLDEILGLQLLVAWAGEGECQPPRLGWWRTDLVDELGGGDFFKRLAPRTHAWAALEAVRHAAMLADRKARARMADPDAVRTLFFWGFELDERLSERLRDLKMADDSRDPCSALPFPSHARPDLPFDRAAVEKSLKALAPEASFQTTSTGRQVKGSLPNDPGLAARTLAAALSPLPETWLPPFYRL